MNDPYETLNRIRKQTDAATEGPWEEGERCVFTQSGAPVVSDDVVHYVNGMAGEGVCHGEDAEFIAAARTDVPALVAALEKVLRLHPRVVVLHADPEFGRMEDDAICGACIVNHEAADWPCPNVRAITTALEAIR